MGLIQLFAKVFVCDDTKRRCSWHVAGSWVTNVTESDCNLASSDPDLNGQSFCISVSSRYVYCVQIFQRGPRRCERCSFCLTGVFTAI